MVGTYLPNGKWGFYSNSLQGEESRILRAASGTTVSRKAYLGSKPVATAEIKFTQGFDSRDFPAALGTSGNVVKNGQ